MISNAEFTAAAEELGFGRVYFLPVDDIPTPYVKLVSSPKALLPGAKTLILLIMPYELTDDGGCREGVISPYYKASQKAYKGVKFLEKKLIDSGAQAVCNANIPLKAAIVKYDIGVQRLNSLTYINGIGSAFHIQNIITDIAFEYSRIDRSFSITDCSKCLHCLRACPSGAISTTGFVDPNRCLRFVSELKQIPAEFENNLGNKLLGCDECQKACPHNMVAKTNAQFAYPLEKLLKGDLGELPELIGTNLARKTRMICKACVLAANNNRTDLLPLIRELEKSSDTYISAAARRAIERLEVIT
jgi:epoxyqueuosine reductase QueG